MENLPTRPVRPDFALVKAEQGKIQQQQKKIQDEIKALKSKADSQNKSNPEDPFNQFQQTKTSLADLTSKIDAISQKQDALQLIFTNKQLDDIKNKLGKIKPTDEAIQAEIERLEHYFAHENHTRQEETKIRGEITNLQKIQLTLQRTKIDQSAVDNAREEFKTLNTEKKQLLNARRELKEKMNEQYEIVKQLREDNKATRSTQDTIYVEIKAKYALLDDLKKQHQEIFEKHQTEMKAFDILKKQHDDLYKATQEVRQKCAPITKKLIEMNIKFSENFGKYDIEKPNFAERTSDEIPKQKLISWLESQIELAEIQPKVEVLSQKRLRQQSKKTAFFDYSGFSVFSDLGLNGSDFPDLQSKIDLKLKLQQGGEEEKMKKIAEEEAKVLAVLGELVDAGGVWQFVDKVVLKPRVEKKEGAMKNNKSE